MKIKSAKYISGREIKIILESNVPVIIHNNTVNIDTILLKTKNKKYYLNTIWIPNDRLRDFNTWEYNCSKVKFINYSENELNKLINHIIKDVNIIPLSYINTNEKDYYDIRCVDDVLDLKHKLSDEYLNKKISEINYKFSKKCENDTGINSLDFLKIVNSFDYIKRNKGTLLDVINYLN